MLWNLVKGEIIVIGIRFCWIYESLVESIDVFDLSALAVLWDEFFVPFFFFWEPFEEWF